MINSNSKVRNVEGQFLAAAAFKFDGITTSLLAEVTAACEVALFLQQWPLAREVKNGMWIAHLPLQMWGWRGCPYGCFSNPTNGSRLIMVLLGTYYMIHGGFYKMLDNGRILPSERMPINWLIA
ncbi:ribonuclease H protein [Pyrus ussuriensis x Pyrus communis]|uniref:Ribonuclease H protein n=1 Tax=Pyrus ussuriensis x Pyrus communis TaxID=2448454 RepID=A0A5N5HQB2_9ROSA|nr:ribonuclease H protein [Pyrus ussuriensis x Pyrus communis]